MRPGRIAASPADVGGPNSQFVYFNTELHTGERSQLGKHIADPTCLTGGNIEDRARCQTVAMCDARDVGSTDVPDIKKVPPSLKIPNL